MAFWIGHTLKREREKAGLSTQEVAVAMGVHSITVDRLERGESMGRDISKYIATYAHLLGMEDGRDLWQMALDSWQAEGSPPVFTADGPAAAFAQVIRDAALRHRQAASKPQEPHRNTTRTKRAAG
jgi:transcriptional regulator with XRE-family HTH domain